MLASNPDLMGAVRNKRVIKSGPNCDDDDDATKIQNTGFTCGFYDSYDLAILHHKLL